MTERPPQGVDPRTPNAARMYDYFLGGKDNFQADRELGDLVLSVMPEIRVGTRENRALIGRVVQYLCEQGITQFLDLGSGLPAQENVHEVAHRHAPEARVVYVDNDPVVASHGRAMLADPNRVAIVLGDIRRPEEILTDPEVRGLLDFDRPVAVLMMFVLHLISDEDDPQGFMAAYRDALAPGSYLAISHGTNDVATERVMQVSEFYKRANAAFTPRPGGEIGAFFGDFELIPPGLATGPGMPWPFTDPDHPLFMDEEMTYMAYAGIGRKP
ncbi:SAM-dependent methyltransferase [Nonomuraea turkmeniaca]|uniref:SAM-dependent methyltransferase n=1 Tax=Nonomuraea turkmeniaca TaxID=103838 RepID=A0A5S4FT68_9ACTN|nr:SAM-dependent methyltransferase [Nonomuraea turkmeniaca]TMR23564.1 SAM-dependent methyltransferase [Nonomuraea turkmeniaca]